MADSPQPAYDGDEPYVFVSYSHEDEELVYPEIRWMQDQGFLQSIVTVITTTHTAGTEDIILVDDDTAGGAVTVTLPPVVENKGVLIYIKKTGSTGTVTVDANLLESIDGATTSAMTTQYDSLTIACDGLSWHIL